MSDTEENENDLKDDEPVPWWRCCCPPKKPEDDVDDKGSDKKRTSVEIAEKRLSIYDKVEELDTSAAVVVPKYLPLTFIPDFIIYQIFEDPFSKVPYAVTSNVVLLIADVCGFTSLCESFCQKGVSGIEQLTNVLNGFMSALAAILLESGGDILNFAGDAFLVQWIEDELNNKSIERAVVKAYECAVALQTHPCLLKRNLGGTLKVKIGIGMGEVSIWCLGSEKEFLLFVACGPALPSAQRAESLCEPGDIIIDQNMYQKLKEEKNCKFTPALLDGGFVKVTDYPVVESSEDPEPNRIRLFKKCGQDALAKAKTFLMPALRELRFADEIQYISELTTVIVLFIALPDVNVAKPKVLDETFNIIFESAKTYEGVVNKMLLFDKGCTFLVLFGLPGKKHSNDAVRGISCADDVSRKFEEMKINASVGVTSGMCFCGIVGHPQRQEYTVIGSSVNLAARIMVIYRDQKVALNVQAYLQSRDELGENNFVELPARKMKGINYAGAVYAYRKQFARKTAMSVASSTFDIVEDSNLYGSTEVKKRLKQALTEMANETVREDMKKKTLLPVIIVKGQKESGKSYIMYYVIDCALAAGHRFAACCAIPSFRNENFWVISQVVRRLLDINMLGSYVDRENIIMSYLPEEDYPDLYLLNHLFHCEFAAPEIIITDTTTRNERIIKIFKTIIHQFCSDGYVLITIDNADFIDDQSWAVFLQLAETENVFVIFSLSVDFKEMNASSSSIHMKAYQTVNTENFQEDIFAPLLCWFLGVDAIHTSLFKYLKYITEGKIPILKEISLSAAMSQVINVVPLESINETRLKNEFFVDKFEVLRAEKPLACDLKRGVNLKKANIPTNINDVVKECLNNLNIQERLLLKRAAVIGADFDLHSLESISSGISQSEVLQSVGNLLSNHIFSSACSLENRVETFAMTGSTINVDPLNICFCFSVYLRHQLKNMNAPRWPIGPYHRLEFRTHEFRSAMLASMTREQVYSMRIEAAETLESKAVECATCWTSRGAGVTSAAARDGAKGREYSVVFKECVCLTERPRVYSEIAQLYSTLGMLYLPLYFKRKAAQAAVVANYPVQALYYLEFTSRKMPQYWLMSREDQNDEESYFDPKILDISIKKTTAEAFLSLGDTYNAVTTIYAALEMLGIDPVCFHGIFSPSSFQRILSKYNLIHAECVTKLIGVLAKAFVKTQNFPSAYYFLKLEFIALKSYPIDFVMVLSHMTTTYEYKYLSRETKHLLELESNIFKLCRERLRKFELLIDLTEINAIGKTYAFIVRVTFSLTHFDRCKNAATEAIRILQINNYKGVLPLIRIFLSHLYLYLKDYEMCCKVVLLLLDMHRVTESRIYYSLSVCSLSLFLTESLIGVPKNEVQYYYDICNAFASTWKTEAPKILQKDLIFYISVVMSYWSIYADKKTSSITGRDVFTQCYKLAKTYQDRIDRIKYYNYWTISGLMLLLRIEIKLLKKTYKEIPVDAKIIQKELTYLKDKVKFSYPVFLDEYKDLVKTMK